MVDLEREYEKARTLCRNKRKEVEFVISLLDNFQEKIVLEMRYLNYYDWQEIAIQLNYSIQAVYYIHGRALMHILEVNKQAEQTSGKPFF